MIRPIQEGDYRRFVELASQLGYPVDLDHARQELTRQANGGDETTLVFDDPLHGVVGWVGCRVHRLAYRPACGDVAGLVVDEAHRGRGVGKALLAASEDWFRAQGLEEVIVRSGGQRLDAHRFYDREGYARLKTQVVFRKTLV